MLPNNIIFIVEIKMLNSLFRLLFLNLEACLLQFSIF